MYFSPFFSMFAAVTLVASHPLPHPDIKEILLAHTNPGEFAKVHSPTGIADKALFKSGHNAAAPNPPNSLAAGGKRKRDVVVKSDAIYASLWSKEDPSKLNAKGQAALFSALDMITKMNALEPADADLAANLLSLQSFATQQNMLL